jgi:hypothetical protein
MARSLAASPKSPKAKALSDSYAKWDQFGAGDSSDSDEAESHAKFGMLPALPDEVLSTFHFRELQHYDSFVERHEAELKAYAGLAGDGEGERHLVAHPHLVSGAAHALCWLKRRHIELVHDLPEEARGYLRLRLPREARHVVLLGIAAYLASDASARGPEDIAFLLTQLFKHLPSDRTLRDNVESRVQLYLSHVADHVATMKEGAAEADAEAGGGLLSPQRLIGLGCLGLTMAMAAYLWLEDRGPGPWRDG